MLSNFMPQQSDTVSFMVLLYVAPAITRAVSSAHLSMSSGVSTPGPMFTVRHAYLPTITPSVLTFKWSNSPRNDTPHILISTYDNPRNDPSSLRVAEWMTNFVVPRLFSMVSPFWRLSLRVKLVMTRSGTSFPHSNVFPFSSLSGLNASGILKSTHSLHGPSTLCLQIPCTLTCHVLPYSPPMPAVFVELPQSVLWHVPSSS